MDVKSLGDVKASGPAVLHFWAAWSEPCKVMDRVFATLGKEHAGAPPPYLFNKGSLSI
jgi:thiol-disulfide isomerase/thioredoxin